MSDRTKVLCTILLMHVFILFACSDEVEEESETVMLPDSDTLELRAGCEMKDRLGSFMVYHQESYSFVQGEVADGVVPITILTTIKKNADCRLMKRENPLCEPRCTSDQTCDFDGTCLPFPRNQDIGEITIDGLKETVKMTAIQPGNNYFATELPHPAFNPGDTIRLTSTDGYLGEIQMYGIGVEPLVIVDNIWSMERDKNLNVKWNKPVSELHSSIYLRASVDQHGASPVFLICHMPDTGSYSVPAELVNDLLEYGTSGFPSAILVRRTVDSQEIEGKGCVEFIVGSPREGNISVPK